MYFSISAGFYYAKNLSANIVFNKVDAGFLDTVICAVAILLELCSLIPED